MPTLTSLDLRIESSIRLLARLEVSLSHARSLTTRRVIEEFIETEEESLSCAIELHALVTRHVEAH